MFFFFFFFFCLERKIGVRTFHLLTFCLFCSFITSSSKLANNSQLWLRLAGQHANSHISTTHPYIADPWARRILQSISNEFILSLFLGCSLLAYEHAKYTESKKKQKTKNKTKQNKTKKQCENNP